MKIEPLGTYQPPVGGGDILDALVVGAGFSGLAVAMALQRSLRKYLVLEQADDLGGTWRDNRYPGAACDVPSHLYSLDLMPNPHWSRHYAGQEEILEYMRRCAELQGIHGAFRFGVRVTEARWHPAWHCWAVASDDGQMRYAYTLVIATGALSRPRLPDIPGLQSFQGQLVHSARWPKDLSLRGKRVGVIGTGASAVQIVPAIAPETAALTLFQRTPSWILPRGDKPIPDETKQRFQYDWRRLDNERSLLYWRHEWRAFAFTRMPRLLAQAEKHALGLLQRQVPDAQLRARLTPHYRIGCKRILLSDDFYPALTLPHVKLVDQAVAAATPHGLRSADGHEHALDVVIAATGFDVAQAQTPFAVFGQDGVSLGNAWQDTGPQAYLGTMVHGFPNMFLMTGPNTGLGHNSMLGVIDAQTNFIEQALALLDSSHAVAALQVKKDVQERFNDEIQRRMKRTVWMTGGCSSWYLSADGKNHTLWPDFTFRLYRALNHPDWDAFEKIRTS